MKIKVKDNGHEQTFTPNGALRLKLRDRLASKLDGCPVVLSSPFTGPKPAHDENRWRVKLRLGA